MKFLVPTCLLGALLTTLPQEADACTIQTSCRHELRLGADLHAEAVGVVWDLGITPDSPQDLEDFIVLQKLEPSQDIQLDVDVRPLETRGEVLIVPEEGFQPESTYELSVTFPEELFADICYNQGTLTQVFELRSTPHSSPPVLAARDIQREPYTFVGGPSCAWQEEGAYTDISVQWHHSFLDLRESLEVEVLLDGESTDIPVRADKFTLATSCAGEASFVKDLPEGDYQVIARAKVPGTSTYWDSEPLDVALYCEEPRGCACATSPSPSNPPLPLLFVVFLFGARCLARARDRTTR